MAKATAGIDGVFAAILGFGAATLVGGVASLYYFPNETIGVVGGHLVAGEVVGTAPWITVGLDNPYLPYWLAGGVAGRYVQPWSRLRVA